MCGNDLLLEQKAAIIHSKPKTMGAVAGLISRPGYYVEDGRNSEILTLLWVEAIFFVWEVIFVPTAQKAQVIAETRDDFERAKAAVLADYRGLTVHQMGQLRRKLAERGVVLKVIKNTLIKRAADEAGVEGLDPYLSGPTAVAFSYDDPVVAAKLMAEAIREFRRMEIKAGVLGKSAFDARAVRSLADLPSREVLLGKLVGTLNAPIQQLAWVLNAPLSNLARALDQVRLQKEASI